MALYGIVMKSPWAEGRWGPTSWQDWYQQCVIAVRQAKPEQDILATCSANALPGTSTPETSVYEWAIAELQRQIRIADRGTETVSHVRALGEYARELQQDLVLVVTWTHSLRVCYIAHRYGIKARFLIAWGLPRPRELVTDAVLTVLYPILCWLGREEAFLNSLEQRRKSGTF